jgi:hypothetical protein
MKKRVEVIRHGDISKESRRADGFNAFLCYSVYCYDCSRCYRMNCSKRRKLLRLLDGTKVDI